MHVLFIRDSIKMGGIETIIIRMSQKLLDDGHRVTILTHAAPEEGLRIPSGVRLIVHRRFFHLLVPAYARWFSKRHLGDITAIPSFDRLSFCLAALFSRYAKNNPAVTCMVYSPWEMRPPNTSFYHSQRNILDYPCHLFDRLLPDSQKSFMSPHVQRAHETAYRRNFTDAAIFPVPIRVPDELHKRERRVPHPGLIVSVGRLCDKMKQYNYTALDSIRELLDAGLEIRWDIYGSGPLHQRIKGRIAELGLQSAVFLHGDLPYERFNATVKRARVFLGMGTAALEAAILGVPVVIAHAATFENSSHGFLHNQPFGIIGEITSEVPSRPIAAFLQQVFESDSASYEMLASAERTAAERYGFEALMDTFYRFISRAVPIHPSLLDSYRYAVSCKLPAAFFRRPPSDPDFFNPQV